MICLDIESTGLQPDQNSIVALGALSLADPSDRFYMECRIWDGSQIDNAALNVNGFTVHDVTDHEKCTEAELVQAFLKWSQKFTNRILAGQNVSFDRSMLQAAIVRAGLSLPISHRTIDCHSLCWMHMVKQEHTPPIDQLSGGSALNLDSILHYCGIPHEPHPHHALTGALSHAEVIHRILYDKPLLPEFVDYPLPWQA